jgi:hypothetical protein
MHPLSLFTISLLPYLLPCAITATSAISLAPSLFNYSPLLEDTLANYKAIQIQIAAIKLKSLLPHTGGAAILKTGSKVASDGHLKKAAYKSKKDGEDEDEESSSSPASSDNNNSDDDDESSDDDEVPTSTTLILFHFNNFIKKLDTPLAAQVTSFDLSFQSLDDFVAAKEHEASLKLQESLEAIRDIQRILQPQPSTNTSQIVSSQLLARLVAKLDALQDEYDEIQTLEKRLKSSKEDKRKKAKNELINSHIKIQKIAQRLSEIIAE